MTRSNSPELLAWVFIAANRLTIDAELKLAIDVAAHPPDIPVQLVLRCLPRLPGDTEPGLAEQVVALEPGRVVPLRRAFQPRRPHDAADCRPRHYLGLAAGYPVQVGLESATGASGLVH